MNLTRACLALAVVLMSPVVLAGPTAPPAVSATALAKPSGSPAPALTVVNPTDAEAARANAHVFKPPHVVVPNPDEQKDGPSLVVVGKIVVPPPGPKKPTVNLRKFGETVHAAFKDKVRGYALGVRKNGQPVHTGIWDWARTPEEGRNGWTLDTRMHVASVSKMVTAIVATKMLDERGLTVDTRIGDYIPTYWTVGKGSSDLTFRHLLTHRTGFTDGGGDYASFKQRIENGASPGAGYKYTNGSFSLVRVLNATMTGAVPRDRRWMPIPLITLDRFGRPIPPATTPTAAEADAFNDKMWDIKATEAFRAYAQAKVFTPSGVSNVASTSTSTSSRAYAQKSSTTGWDSGDVFGQLGGAGFRLSVNDMLDVMGTFRRKGTIVSPQKAQAALDAWLGVDRIISTPAGKIYEKNGMWYTGDKPTKNVEQAVACFLPDDVELVVLVNSWIGMEQASLRNTIRDAYLASLE